MELILYLREISGLGQGFIIAALGLMVLTALLLQVKGITRSRLRLAAVLEFLGAVGIGACALLLRAGVLPDGFLFRLLRDLSDVLIAVAAAAVLGALVFDILLERLKVHPPPILTELILATAYVAVTILVLGEVGRDVSSVLTTGAIATAAIGFSLQDTLRSVMGGISVQGDQSIRPGDWIRIDSLEGRVTEVRWRQTSMVSRDGDTVVIPNSHLANVIVTILGRHGRGPVQSRRWIHFEVDHGVPTGHVAHAIETALREDPVPGIALTPPPDVVLTDLRSAWQTFAARYWLKNLPEDIGTDSMVRSRIITALHRAGITFSFPAQTIFWVPKDVEHLAHERESERQRRLAALAQVPVFAPLTDDERAALADRLHATAFTSREVITRQGATASWLYLVVRGTCRVRVASEPGGPETEVATLLPGDFFGEMALLTGAPRSATVVAATEVLCYRLDRESVLEIIQARPAMAEEISRVLARRRVELEAARENLNDEESRRQRLVTTEVDILGRIRRFFGIVD